MLAQVHEVVRAADDGLDIDPALAACVQLALASTAPTALLGLTAVRFLMSRLARASPRAQDPANLSRARALRYSARRARDSAVAVRYHCVMPDDPKLQAQLWDASGRTECGYCGSMMVCLERLAPAARAARAKVVRALIRRGANINGRNLHDWRRCALHYAAATGNLEVIALLVEAGASLELGAIGASGTPLSDAIAAHRTGDTATVGPGRSWPMAASGPTRRPRCSTTSSPPAASSPPRSCARSRTAP